MRAIQNAGGHVGLSARNYSIAANTAVAAGQVVKLSGGLVVCALAAETGAILGIAAENHPGTADALNARANGTEIMVYDNPELIFECPVPCVEAASGTATTLVPKSGDIAAAAANDAYNGGMLVLKSKAEASTNTDAVGKQDIITDYTASGTVIAKNSGGTPAAGDVYELYPPIGSAVCALDTGISKLIVSAAGCTKIKVVGHEYARHMLRCMAVEHTLGVEN